MRGEAGPTDTARRHSEPFDYNCVCVCVGGVFMYVSLHFFYLLSMN